MADLEIGPEPSRFVSSTPSIPSTSPIQEQLQRSAAETQLNIRRAATLISAIERQNENHTAAAALVTYKNKLNSLDENVANIQDLPTRLNLYKTGLSNISDELRQQYPKLSDSTFKTIELEMTNDYKQHYLKTVADRVAQGGRDIKALQDNTVRTAAVAKTDQERQLLETGFYNYLDKSVANGIIHQDEANDLKTKTGRAVHFQMGLNLINQNPAKALQLTANDGYSPSELYDLHTRALHIINQSESVGHKAWHDKTDQAMTEAMSTTDESRLLDLYNHGYITKGMYQSRVGHPPTEPALTTHVESEIENFNGTPDELDKKWRNEVLTYPWETGDFRILSNAYGKKRSDLQSDFKRHSNDLYSDLHEYLIGRDPMYYNTGMDPFRRLNSTLLIQMKHELGDAKTVEEQHKVYDKYKQQIDKAYQKIKPTPLMPEFGSTTEDKAPPAVTAPEGVVPEYDKP